MELIYTDKEGQELGFLKGVDIDIEVSSEKDSTNTFSVEAKRMNWPVGFGIGSRCFLPGTEYGGIVQGIFTGTKAGKTEFQGVSWRGMLSKKVIEPTPGSDYKIVRGELNAILKEMVESVFPGLFYGSLESTGVRIEGFQFERYCTMLEGLAKLLKSVGHRLRIQYIEERYPDSGRVLVDAVPIKDYSEEIEFSQDDELDFSVREYMGGVNHLICLGKGELRNRLVLHLFVNADGQIGRTQYFFGTEEIVEVYDNSTAEMEDLLKGGIAKLEELKSRTEFSMTIKKMERDIDIGDMVGGRDYMTGLSVKKPIGKKIWRVTKGEASLEYKLEGEK